MKRVGIEDIQRHFPDLNVVKQTGHAGTRFVANTVGYHRGTRILRKKMATGRLQCLLSLKVIQLGEMNLNINYRQLSNSINDRSHIELFFYTLIQLNKVGLIVLD